MAGRETVNERAISPAGRIPARRRSSTARRVGSASALKAASEMAAADVAPAVPSPEAAGHLELRRPGPCECVTDRSRIIRNHTVTRHCLSRGLLKLLGSAGVRACQSYECHKL
jgi:hypothetical protein